MIPLNKPLHTLTPLQKFENVFRLLNHHAGCPARFGNEANGFKKCVFLIAEEHEATILYRGREVVISIKQIQLCLRPSWMITNEEISETGQSSTEMQNQILAGRFYDVFGLSKIGYAVNYELNQN